MVTPSARTPNTSLSEAISHAMDSLLIPWGSKRDFSTPLYFLAHTTFAFVNNPYRIQQSLSLPFSFSLFVSLAISVLFVTYPNSQRAPLIRFGRLDESQRSFACLRVAYPSLRGRTRRRAETWKGKRRARTYMRLQLTMSTKARTIERYRCGESWRLHPRCCVHKSPVPGRCVFRIFPERESR